MSSRKKKEDKMKTKTKLKTKLRTKTKEKMKNETKSANDFALIQQQHLKRKVHTTHNQNYQQPILYTTLLVPHSLYKHIIVTNV